MPPTDKVGDASNLCLELGEIVTISEEPGDVEEGMESAQSRGADGRITARADRRPFLAPMQASDQMIAAGLSNEDSAVGFGV